MSIRTEIVFVLIAAFSMGYILEARADFTVYSNDFHDHYPKVGQKIDLDSYGLEAPIVIWNSDHNRKITILMTRGDKYDHEKQKCVITVEGGGLKSPRFLSILGFRSIVASWITGKLILIQIDIGHLAGVEAIYDAERNKLLYCESLSYIIESDGAAKGFKSIRSKQIQRHR